jgi:hypothetical protein
MRLRKLTWENSWSRCSWTRRSYRSGVGVPVLNYLDGGLPPAVNFASSEAFLGLCLHRPQIDDVVAFIMSLKDKKMP